MKYLESLNATVSHEMMTPLNCIVAFAEKIAVDAADSQSSNNAGIISKTAKLLKMNLKDLLDRNLIEKGVLEPVLQPNKLSVLISEVIEIMQYQANSKSQTILH
jgi:K+-sensing histidine kinase KdpD